MENKMLEAALQYLALGLCVIPVKPYYDHEEGKFLKRPYIKWLPYKQKMSTEAELRQWWTRWPDAMIGIMTGKITGICAVDCDSAAAYEHIQSMMPDSYATATAKTPRGGRHLWFKCSNGNMLPVATKVFPNTDVRGEGGYIIAPPSINEHGGQYQWIDGLGFEALQEPPLNIISTIKGVIGGERSSNLGTQGDSCSITDITRYNNAYTILQKGTRDADLFRIGMALADGHLKWEDILQTLSILAKNCNPPFPEKELAEKIKSVFDRISRKERNLMDEVREWCLLQKGYFNTTSLRHELHITTKSEIKNLSVILNRLQADGITEKHGEKRGEYRTKEQKSDLEMTFIEEDIPEFDIKLPFGLNSIVSLYPKNIIIVAGSKSAGKTALMMKIALDNQDRYPVVYFNSEMGDEEWSNRLKKMGIRRQEQIKLKAIGVHQNFHDMMDGTKKIYFVDYLEIHDNFYEIAKPIRKIHETIKDGICFIGVQKKKGEMYSRGGAFSAEKSRLYLSLDFLEEQRCTQLTIADAKSPKIPENVSGWSKRIKIIDGSKMEVLDRDWRF